MRSIGKSDSPPPCVTSASRRASVRVGERADEYRAIVERTTSDPQIVLKRTEGVVKACFQSGVTSVGCIMESETGLRERRHKDESGGRLHCIGGELDFRLCGDGRC